MGDQQGRREIGEQRPLHRAVRPGQLEQQFDGDLEPVQWIALAGGGGADLVRGTPQRVLEQREQQFVLAPEGV
jgi:hypothetical protein